MDRRQFIRAASAATTSIAAGCSSGGAWGVPGDTTTSRTATTTTKGASEVEPADVAPYTDWLVNRPKSSLFQVDYWPEYDTLYQDYEYDYGSARRYLKRLVEQSNRASDVLSATDVTSYFLGFVEEPGTMYEYIQGSFSPSDLRPKLESEWELEPADESIRGLEVMGTGTVAVGFSEEAFFWVQLRGFADASLNDLLDSIVETVQGDAESYVKSNEDYELLFQHLQKGHKIVSRPSDTETYGCSAYGRQFLIDSKNAAPEEVLVWDQEPDQEDVASRVRENSPLIEQMGTGIDEVVVDGRVSRVRLTPVHNSRILRVTGYVS